MFQQGVSQTAIAKKKHFPRTTVLGYCKKAEEIVKLYESDMNSDAKCRKTHQYEGVDRPLLNFFRQVQCC